MRTWKSRLAGLFVAGLLLGGFAAPARAGTHGGAHPHPRPAPASRRTNRETNRINKLYQKGKITGEQRDQLLSQVKDAKGNPQTPAPQTPTGPAAR